MKLHVLILLWSGCAAVLPAQSFTTAESMHEARLQHTATLLNDGTVLVTGGVGSDGQPTNSAEIYNPQAANWHYTSTGQQGQQTKMGTPRTGHTATKLADGRVLLAGGYTYFQPNSGVGGTTASPTITAEIFDPATGTFTWTGSLATPHTGAQAVLLNDGRVMLVGENSSPTPSELYSPSLGTWSANLPALTTGYGSAVANLANGSVFLTGGLSCCAVLSTAAIYAPATNTLQTLANLLAVRASAGAVVLPNGQILVVGGYDDSGPCSQ